jgi:hypothetical protein
VQIKEIKVGELLGFIQSDEYKKLDIKPITDLRAISQFNNPDSKSEDLALIYSVENDNLLGFAGLLPKSVCNENIRIFANSCWWVHPEKGRGIAIPLFYKLLERANFSLFLSESTTQAKTILEKTGIFGPIVQTNGVRVFLLFYLADIFQKRFPNIKWLSYLIKFVDFLLNLLLVPFRFYFVKKFDKSTFTIEQVSKVDKSIEDFIRQNCGSEFIQKTAAHFEWFKKYPWVTDVADNKSVKYPFSYRVKKYELNYYVFKLGTEIKAFSAISNRDNLAKIPFLYFNEKDFEGVAKSLVKLLITKKYESLLVFHPQIIDFMEQSKMPYYFRKNEVKYSGTTKQICNIFAQKRIMQDGDGDVIFT